MEAAEVDEAVRAEEEVGDQRSDCVQVTWNINMIPNVKAFTERTPLINWSGGDPGLTDEDESQSYDEHETVAT